ncbi:MAG: hypothetical protein AABX89_04970 [Candidatus Thermoplasmatota archaeon]
MNPLKSIGISFRLTAASLKLIFQKPIALVLPLLTLAWTALWVLAPVNWWIYQAEHDPDGAAAFWKAVFFMTVNAYEAGNYSWMVTSAMITFYVIWAIFMTIVLTGALYVATVGMDVATQQIKTQDGKLGPAFKLASRNLGRIFLLALTLATLVAWFRYTTTFVLRMIPFVGRWVNRVLRAVLSAVTYLMLPIIIYERAGPINALKSAWRNVRKTWAGLLVGTGLIYFSAWLVLNVVTVGLFQGALGLEGWSAVLPPVILGAILYAIASSSGAAMRATLYWYATTGEVPAGFRIDDLPKVENPSTFTVPSIPTPLVAPRPVAAAAPSASTPLRRPAVKPAGAIAIKPASQATPKQPSSAAAKPAAAKPKAAPKKPT